MAKILATAVLLCHATVALAAWTDISAAIAARESSWTPVATGASADQQVGPFRAAEDAAEFVADGRVFDTFFWHEAFSAFVGIAPKSRPGFMCMFY